MSVNISYLRYLQYNFFIEHAINLWNLSYDKLSNFLTDGSLLNFIPRSLEYLLALNLHVVAFFAYQTS